jgi:WS/DGAT/MGAT family acyltransferase
MTASLADVKAVRAAFGTTVNDVVLAAAAGGLRSYLLAHDALPAEPLVGSMPVSTRAEHERSTWGNRLAKVYVSLRTDIADPVERLRASHEAAEIAKADLARTRGARLENWIEYLPLPVLRAIGRLLVAQIDRGRSTENLVVSNVPGPRAPLYVDGAPLESFFSVGPLTDGVGLNLTAWSYVDQLNVCLLACRESVPDLWFLTDCLRDALEELKKAAAETQGRTS